MSTRTFANQTRSDLNCPGERAWYSEQIVIENRLDQCRAVEKHLVDLAKSFGFDASAAGKLRISVEMALKFAISQGSQLDSTKTLSIEDSASYNGIRIRMTPKRAKREDRFENAFVSSDLQHSTVKVP